MKERLAHAVAELVPFCHSLNEQELLLVTYVDYPDSAKNSIEVGQVMAQRKALAKGLLQRKLISKSRAAELADVPVREVLAW
jgi:predicted HTH domain antitoxin